MNAASAYGARRGPDEASELVTRHAELVKRIAYHLVGRLPPSVEVDDLMQAGMLGLLEAASNYAPNRGAMIMSGRSAIRRLNASAQWWTVTT